MALNTRIQTRRDTAANWESKNPVLLNGEMIIVTTNAGDIRLKIGDGIKTYTQLPFQDETLYNALSGKADAADLEAKAPVSHASTDNTYGIGTGDNYGHVKLSDSTISTSTASAGIAASPAAVKAAYDLASTAQTTANEAKAAATASGSAIYTGTIGTTWTEDEETGVKSQQVAISGITAAQNAKLEHDTTSIDGTSDGYAAYVEEENQFLTCITNGYAETYDGGIVFHIFGDAPTVTIPFWVEVC